MLHQHHHFWSTSHQVHSSTHPLQQFLWDHPISNIAIFTYLHSSQYRHIEVTSSNYCERFRRRKVWSSLFDSDSLLHIKLVTLLALIFLPVAYSRVGYGPTPIIPFSLCRLIWIPWGRSEGMRVGIPIPRLMYIPSWTSCTALFAIFKRIGSVCLFFFVWIGFSLKVTFPFLKSFSLTNSLISDSPLMTNFYILMSE